MNRLDNRSATGSSHSRGGGRHSRGRVTSFQAAEEVLHWRAEPLVGLNKAADERVTARGSVGLHAAKKANSRRLPLLRLVNMPYGP